MQMKLLFTYFHSSLTFAKFTQKIFNANLHLASKKHPEPKKVPDAPKSVYSVVKFTLYILPQLNSTWMSITPFGSSGSNV